MKRFKAAVYGGSGYLGSEAVRRLSSHPAVELAHVYAADYIGEPLSAALPNLEGKTSLRFEPVPELVPPGVDILLLALPHEVSHRVVARAIQSSVRIIDMSGAFRVNDAEAHAKFYGARHPLPELLPPFLHGSPQRSPPPPTAARRTPARSLFPATHPF